MSHCTSIAFCCAILLGIAPAQARVVLCVSDEDSSAYAGAVSNAEGYYRYMLGFLPAQVGGNLTNCLAQVQTKDVLYIVAHGNGDEPIGQSFIWKEGPAPAQRKVYSGFGAGPGQVPLPVGFEDLENVTGWFATCWSARDPDDTGPDKPLVDELMGAMGGAGQGHSIQGFVEAGIAKVGVTFLGGTKAQQNLVWDEMKKVAATWVHNPPANRWSEAVTQETEAQAVADQLAPPAGTVVVSLSYLRPEEGPCGSAVVVRGSDTAQWGCCECSECGIARAVFFEAGIPALPTWGAMVLTLLLLTAGTLVFRSRVMSDPLHPKVI